MDALKSFKPSEGGGLFVRFEADKPVKLRILTNDPLVSIDQWANTRYSFIVWNYNESKAQILSKGMSILKQLQALHLNDDWGGDIREVDIQITSTGEGMETRYTVMPLPKSEKLTKQMVDEAAQIDLEARIDNGIRLSKVNEGVDVPSVDVNDMGDKSLGDTFRAQRADNIKGLDEVADMDPDEEPDLSSIPF